MLILLTFLLSLVNCQLYHNQFAVELIQGQDPEIFASEYGFENLGEFFSNHFLFSHHKVNKRSTEKSHEHHKSLQEDQR